MQVPGVDKAATYVVHGSPNSRRDNFSLNSSKLASTGGSLRKPSLLIVEDDADQLEFLGRRFRRIGFQVTAIGHPRQAMVAVSARQFDVALLDMSLPEIDGIELMARLQRMQAGLPVVILSGFKYPESQAKQLGAFACLVKVCPFELIKKTIERAMEVTQDEEVPEPSLSMTGPCEQ